MYGGLTLFEWKNKYPLFPLFWIRQTKEDQHFWNDFFHFSYICWFILAQTFNCPFLVKPDSIKKGVNILDNI